MSLIISAYIALFLGSFAAATIVPFPSEGLLIGYFQMDYSVWVCVAIATIGNTIGGLTNYFIGKLGSSDRVLKRCKLDEDKLEKWYLRSSKWGHYLGLVAWLPIVGDPMIVALGFFKTNFWPLALFTFIGKLLRYLVIAIIYLTLA